MFTTGNPFSDLLTYLSLALPLLSICFILFRKEYTDNSTTLIMVLCLFYFIQRLLVLYHGLFEFSYPIAHNIFNFVEFLLLVFMLRASFPEPKSHYILNSFLVAYLSCIITYYGIRGFGTDEFELRLIQYGLVVMMMIASLVFLAKTEQMTMMGKPLFWIILGTLFYFAFCTFWEVGKKYLFAPINETGKEIDLFPLMIITIRFVFYALAMWLLRSQEMVVKTNSIPLSHKSFEEGTEEFAYFNLMTAVEIPGEKVL